MHKYIWTNKHLHAYTYTHMHKFWSKTSIGNYNTNDENLAKLQADFHSGKCWITFLLSAGLFSISHTDRQADTLSWLTPPWITLTTFSPQWIHTQNYPGSLLPASFPFWHCWSWSKKWGKKRGKKRGMCQSHCISFPMLKDAQGRGRIW